MSLTNLLEPLNLLIATCVEAPLLIGITGGSAVGKSTLSAYLGTLLGEQYPAQTINVIGADSFIYPNTYLKQHHLMAKKGFPISFDWRKFQLFLADLSASDQAEYNIPFYSQDLKDIDPNCVNKIPASDIYVIEGINLLFDYDDFRATDYLDYCIYLDIDVNLAKQRSIKRFLTAYKKATENAANQPDYFKPLLNYTAAELYQYAENLWNTIDVKLLETHLQPHKHIADLIITSLPELRK